MGKKSRKGDEPINIKEKDQKRQKEKNRKKKLNVLFSNCDTLTNKMPEFQANITLYSPDIIGLNEVKPKNSKTDITSEEFRVQGYHLLPHKNITQNEGRGTVIYTKEDLNATQIDIDVNKESFEEAVFCKIRLDEDSEILVGCFYRRGSSSQENNDIMLRILKEISKLKYNYILLMGDFNLPDINWMDWTCSTDETSNINYQFIECLRDSYFFQHIVEPTRARGTDKQNTLDLILTSEEGMVSNIDIAAPLGKSNHSVITLITFSLNIGFQKEAPAKRRFLYDKGDYESMIEELESIDWTMELRGKEVNEQWDIFCGKLKESEGKHIPSRMISRYAKTKKRI